MRQTAPMPSLYEDMRGVILANDDLQTVATRLTDGDEPPAPPWTAFVDAAASDAAGDRQAAIRSLRSILDTQDLEARLYLQAWTCLRALGEAPADDEAKVARGVIVEVGLDQGTDVVAGYQDLSARYFNQAGGGIFWDERSPTIDPLVAAYLDAGQAVAAATGPMDGPIPGPAANGEMLIAILTFGGIHIGYGPMDALGNDPMGNAMTSTALPLMQALIELTATT